MPVVSNSEFRLAAKGGENVKGAFRDVSKAANDAARSVANSNRRASDGINEQALAFGNLSRSARANLTNVSFQVQDFAVQVASGTSAVRALSQQLPQLLGGFGLLGALAGTAVAAVGGLVAVFADFGDKAESVEDLLKNALAGVFDDRAKEIDRLKESLAGATAAQARFIATTAGLEAQQREIQAGGLIGGLDLDRIVTERATIETRRRIDEGEASPTDQGLFSRLRAEFRTDILNRLNGAVRSGDVDTVVELIAELNLGANAQNNEIATQLLQTTQSIAFAKTAQEISEQTFAGNPPTPPSGTSLLRTRPRQSTRRDREERIEATPAPEFNPFTTLATTGDRVANALDVIEQAKLAEQERFEATEQAKQEAFKRTERVAQHVGQSIVGSFESAIFAGQSFSDTLAGLGEDLARLSFRKGATAGIDAIISSFMFPGSVDTTQATPAPAFNPFTTLANAKGNAFSDGKIIPFAGGGIVDRPTIFPMARGIGLMGEAGPEAVMPLRRGANGRLGVESNGGGANVQVTVIDQRSNNAPPVEISQEQGITGVTQIRALIRSELRQEIGHSGQGSVLGRRFGLRPALKSA